MSTIKTALGFATKTLSRYRYTLLAVALSSTLTGCYFIEPKAPLPSDPTKLATSTQIEADAQQYLVRLQMSRDMLQKQRELLNKILGTIGTLVQTIPDPTGTTQGLIMSVLAVFGAGAGLDNLRKDKVISKLTAELVPPVDPMAPRP